MMVQCVAWSRRGPVTPIEVTCENIKWSHFRPRKHPEQRFRPPPCLIDVRLREALPGAKGGIIWVRRQPSSMRKKQFATTRVATQLLLAHARTTVPAIGFRLWMRTACCIILDAFVTTHLNRRL